jgi:hypothetical protein
LNTSSLRVVQVVDLEPVAAVEQVDLELELDFQ